ncbi:hypothetical protein KKF84_05710 [Myxococcota bacterium]|nr:hypothetical protein [Myxococcota bacterium]MBU1534794.1 hypothetical protein [Myxococcota bacterium]
MVFRTVKKIAAGILTTGFSITLSACYGVMDPQYSPWGRVVDSVTGEGIPGIQVCAVQQTYSQCAVTDESGRYDIPVDQNIHYDDYEICVEDIDGAENGVYAPVCQPVEAYTESPDVDFSLTPEEK